VPSKTRFSLNWLACHLGIRRETLERLSIEAEGHYHPFQEPKSNGGFRVIDNPDNALKTVQSRIMVRLLRPLTFNEAAQGCLPGRSPAKNASRHLGQPCLVGIDLKSFFPSVSHRHVYGIWRLLGYGPDVARLLTRLTTCRGYLPQGAPTSPYLANLVLEPLDEQTGARARELGVTYTRFVDDIAFSGERAREMIAPVMREIGRLGFRISRHKTEVAGAGSQHRVTGYTVNRRGQPSIPKSRRDKVRSAIHQLRLSSTGGQDRTRIVASLRGRIAHIASTNAGSAVRLTGQLDLVLREYTQAPQNPTD